jgi:hypothetical protein
MHSSKAKQLVPEIVQGSLFSSEPASSTGEAIAPVAIVMRKSERNRMIAVEKDE